MDFESVAGDLSSIDKSGISTISNLCKQQITLETRIADLEQELKDAKQQHRKIAEDLLPAAMDEYGFAELKMDDGSQISHHFIVQVFQKIANRMPSIGYPNRGMVR